jgi:hypothetical protein
VAEVMGVIRASCEMALLNPRDERQAGLRVLQSMTRPRVADGATYQFKRGGKPIIGPSVKLAREIARCWGNIQHGHKVISEDDESIHIEGWAWDLEANSRTSKEAKFKKLIQRKRGNQTIWETPDERDLNELILRRAALLQRNALLELFPTDLVDECLDAAANTLSGESQRQIEDDPKEIVRKTIALFDAIGISEEQLKAFGGPWSHKKVAELRGVYNSIQDGHTTQDEHFPSADDSKDTPWPSAGSGQQTLAVIPTEDSPF